MTEAEACADAAASFALFALAPSTSGLILASPASEARDTLLVQLRGLLGQPGWRRLPAHSDPERLTGGLDLAATLAAGRPIRDAGALAEPGVLLLVAAERWPAKHLALVLAAQEATDGLSLVAEDESASPEESLGSALRDRLAYTVAVERLGRRPALDLPDLAALAAARARLPQVRIAEDLVAALCAAAMALGIASLRAPLLAVAAARGLAALADRAAANAADAAFAARLVLSPRAMALPEQADDPGESAADSDPTRPLDTATPESSDADLNTGSAPPDEVILAAARAAIPAGLLSGLIAAGCRAPRRALAGRAGTRVARGPRGRPVGTKPGHPRDGARLDILATLMAALPWQRLRPTPAHGLVAIRRDDFRIQRHKPRSQTTTIFAVDASGSSALARLAEAKGAVELLLAECYVRRDQVAVIGFRGTAATLLLPPTRSLVRARRSLAGLPGGGGTPLAHALDLAREQAEQAARRGETPTIVVLTDGQANVGREGRQGRAGAQADARLAAQAIRAAAIRTLLIDTSARPRPQAQALADALGGRYLALPNADAAGLSRAVRSAPPG